MAKAATTNRKRPEITLSPSKQATVEERATQIWSDLFVPVEDDAEKNAAAFKSASDQLQKLFDALRDRRDESKPVLRERLETAAVIEKAIGKPISELQAAYVQIEIGKDGKNQPMLERVSLPKLRQYAEIEGHPYHGAAVAFLKDHKVRFMEREGRGNGKKAVALEALPGRKAA